MQQDKPKRRTAKEGERWVQVRLSEADHQRLKDWATRDSTSVSYLLRRLAQRALRQDEDKTGRVP